LTVQKEKILLLFPDGVGVRNYLYTKVFQNTKEDLVLFHNFDRVTIAAIKESIPLSGDLAMPEYKESIKEKFLRELICLSRLYYNKRIENNPAILNSWKWHQRTLSKKIFYVTIEKLAPIFKKYDSILKLEQKYQKAIRKNSFYFEVKMILEKEQPKIVFCSHQRGIKVAAVFAAAKDLGVATTTVIYSWDNLPKARLALRADSYLVWSVYMKNEMELYYPEIPADSIHITGTPQFEFYEDRHNIINKEMFFEKYKLDMAKTIICFSGDDSKTSPDDPSYLRDLAAALTKSNLINDYQILLRRCPVDFSGRFDAVVKEFPALIKEAPPLWYYNTSKDWNAVYPFLEDVKLLVSTAFYSEVVINVGSTMAFDFAMFNKPCIFINYDQENKKELGWTVKSIYQYQHFRSMPTNEAVIWLNNKSEISNCLSTTKRNNDSMEQWKKIVIGEYQNASIKIRNILQLD
jgi:hypothetical protein